MMVELAVGFDTRICQLNIWWFTKPYSIHFRVAWLFLDLFLGFDKWFKGEAK